MEPEIRPVAGHEFPAYVAALETSAGRHPDRDPTALGRAREAYAVDRAFAAFDQTGRIVGGTSCDELELTVPGPVVVPASRAALTAVLPTHRGSGLATRLVTHQLRDSAARGEALLIATTSAPGLLRAVGYGAAAAATSLLVDLPATGPAAAGPDPHLRLLAADDLPDVLPQTFDRHRSRRPGQVARTATFWRAWFRDEPLLRIGPSERFAVLHEDADGRPLGYLTYRLRYGELRRQPVEALVVEDLVDTDDRARAALWRYALGFGQATVLQAPNVAPDEPVPWLLDDPRRLRTTATRDFLWLRLVDVATALARRRYAVAGHVTMAVHDPVLAGNAGTYVIEAQADASRCERTSAPPDLIVDVSDLAATFLGRISFTTLVAAGRAIEHTAGSARHASLLFAAERPPWTVTDW